jgi:predicted NUDIX family phosphoesterase
MYCESEYERRIPSEQSSMVEVQQSERNECNVMYIGVLNECKREVGRLMN